MVHTSSRYVHLRQIGGLVHHHRNWHLSTLHWYDLSVTFLSSKSLKYIDDNGLELNKEKDGSSKLGVAVSIDMTVLYTSFSPSLTALRELILDFSGSPLSTTRFTMPVIAFN